MQVMMGNATPHECVQDADGNHVGHRPLAHGQAVVYSWGVAGDYSHVGEGRMHGKDALIHVLSNDITRSGDMEAFTSIVRDWPHHSPNPPTWVWSDVDDLATMIGEAFGIPVGIPSDVEETHWTISGPPGVGPAPTPEEPPAEG